MGKDRTKLKRSKKIKEFDELTITDDFREPLKTHLREKELLAPIAASSPLTVRQHAFGAFPCSRRNYLIFSFQSGF